MRRLPILFLLLLAPRLYATITTVKSFKEVESFLAQHHDLIAANTWLVFDLDNTIMTPDLTQNPALSVQASDPYFYEQKKRYLAEMTKTEKHVPTSEAEKLAYRRAVDEWNAVILKEPAMRLLEPDLPAWLQAKQRVGFVTMGHTARETVLAEVTERQLARLGISFAVSAVSSAPIGFEKNIEQPEPALFKAGIFYVGRGGTQAKDHKGKRFLQLLDQRNKLDQRKKLAAAADPTTVIFIDDRREHVEGMIGELAKRKIPCHGFHIEAI